MMACMLRRLACLALLTLLPAPAGAQQVDSAYTEFDTKRCPHKPGQGPEDGGSWTCPGQSGMVVRLSVGDNRMFVGFGPPNSPDLESSETFPGFNDVYAGRVEWRTRGGRPFATILRWNVVTEADQTTTGRTKASGQVLVVTRLGPGGSCHVGYVDARANPDANVLARGIADQQAAGFRCGADRATVVGKRSPGLAFPADLE